jgi:hypothetical protein
MTKSANYDRGAVERLFESQGGLAARAQLIELGVPPSTIRLREGPGGPWRRVLKGVCASRQEALDGLGRIRAALLYAGPGAVVTGLAALRAHRVAAVLPGDPHIKVLIPHGRRRQSHGFVLIGRTTRPPEPVRIEGCGVAPLPRAAVDACLDLKDKEYVRSIINELVYSRRCTAAELCAELSAHQMQRSARMRAVLAEFSAGIRTGEEAECQERLARAIAPRPVWNRRLVEQATGCVAVLPGAFWPDRGVALEVSPGFLPSPAALDRAAARRRWMASVLRLTVAQVTPTQVRERWDEVWEELRRLLDRPPTYRLPRGYALA